jgi:predicted murein hydrolase (TIGR00659 family)
MMKLLEPLGWLSITIAVFWLSKLVYTKTGKILLTPLLITPIIVIAALHWSGVSFRSYNAGAGLLTKLIEPATIALAVILYKNAAVFKKDAAIITISACCGAALAIVTSASIAYMFGLPIAIIDSLAPRSATTPIAISISGSIGGLPTITAVATLVTGLLSMIVGPLIVKWCRINNPIARGVLFGTSAHSAGITKAMEYDPISGSVATIAMMLTAFVTLVATPWFVVYLQ